MEQDGNESGAPTLRGAISRANTPALFNWLASALSYQGISDRVAYEYMERHGYVTWHDVEQKLGQGVGCPKLESYWHFNGCRYDKISRTCAEPDHIQSCPLPGHDLRNGRLNQTAFSLFLFIRDICEGILVGWIDLRLAEADLSVVGVRLERMRAVSDRAVAGGLWRLRQSPRHGAVLHPAWSSEEAAALDRSRYRHDRHRYPGSQLPAPDRDPPPVRCRPRLWDGLLSAWRLRQHRFGGCRAHRCAAVQSSLPHGFPAVRAARHLALLLAGGL